MISHSTYCLWKSSWFSCVPPLHKTIKCNVFPDDQSKLNGEVKSLELEGVKAAESGELDAAIATFTEVISIAPQWASGYNNRAQAYRLQGDIQGMYTYTVCTWYLATPRPCQIQPEPSSRSSHSIGPLQPLMNCVLQSDWWHVHFLFRRYQVQTVAQRLVLISEVYHSPCQQPSGKCVFSRCKLSKGVGVHSASWVQLRSYLIEK
jgi:hypothetical protein